VNLTRHLVAEAPRWAVDERLLPEGFGLAQLLQARAGSLDDLVAGIVTERAAHGPPLAPIDPEHEVWAGGVTYATSRAAREEDARSAGGSDIYARVYDADRPELFPKAAGWRVVGPGQPIRSRRDARWTVPEPELVLVINRHLEIVGYCAGNDVSSRDIEGENPLYLPQAKVYDGSCALGPGIARAGAEGVTDLSLRLEITRGGRTVFSDQTSTGEMKRSPEELVSYLGRELTFPRGVFLMTGTSLVPPDDFSLSEGDRVDVTVGSLVLSNPVA
jgi:2-dehydro-3-deoxy-D-arabinonate dehydratase